MRVNRDTAIAIVSLLVCGALFITTFYMPPAMFRQMPPYLWPRAILVPLAILSAVLLVKAQLAQDEQSTSSFSLSRWLKFYRNPIICFLLFFIFLVTMPVLGMLIGGLLYVFLTLSFLGGWKPKQLVAHGLIAAIFVIGMWAVFTQLLGVFLPEGTILRVY